MAPWRSVAPCLLVLLLAGGGHAGTSLAVETGKIAVMVISDERHQTRYAANAASIECFCKLQRYEFQLLPDTAFATQCNALSNFFFRRQCIVHQFLLSRSDIEWVMVLDGDIAVLNPQDHRVEDYLGNHVNDVIFCFRFHNNEVMAGHYIVRNTEWGRSFVRDWSLLDPSQASGYGGMNSDNGALHWLLLHRLTDETDRDPECVRAGANGGANYQTAYPAFVACVHRNLAATGCKSKPWHHILFLPHGKCFAYDGWNTAWMWSDSSFMHHSFKNPPQNDGGRVMELGCPPYPIRQASPYYTSNEDVHQRLADAGVMRDAERRRFGYDPDSCINKMAAARSPAL